ncbi:MAG TPA: hypothetical protein VH247_09920 [Thermoleophilaceae bacterium]|nr:hypothetical protein [Thermoleophilaceae bacterium]
MRMRAAGALACALTVCCSAAPAQARPQAVIAFLPAGPGETKPLLDELAARGMAIGMTSPTVGGFKQRQMGLDMTQGTRIPTRLYSGPIGSLRPRGRHLDGWALAAGRARDAPGDLVPGLLASTIEAAGGRVGWSAGGHGFSIAPIVAGNRQGGVSPLKAGDALGVVQLAPGAFGLRQLDELLAARGRDDLVYAVRAPSGTKLRLLPSGIAAPGIHGQLRSATTRRTGLITATDVAPTVLRALGIPVPDKMQGEVIEGRGRADAKAVADLDDRLAVVTSRRGPALQWLACSWLLVLAALQLLAGQRGLRAALRIGLLAALWVPGLALLTAALQPTRLAEAAIVGAGAVVLGALTDRIARWPLGPAIPVAAVFVAHAIDLGAGSALIGASIAGPNPAGGARFYGIGNELEAILSASVLLGTGAALAWRPAAESRRDAIAFAVVAIVAGGIMGAGRLGADVGAVITLGAGGAAAVIASLPRPSRRAVALGIAAPVIAIGALILIDVVTGGGAHLTKSVINANGSGDLADVVRRRFEGSFSTLKKPGWLVAFVIGVAAVVWLAARRERLLEALPRALSAALIGVWFAVVVGTISNDSGPLILEIGAIFLLLGTGYARSRPRIPVERPR